MDQLVTTEWLAGELGSTDLRVLDCHVVFERVDGDLNVESGYRLWEAGHIPTSAFVDLIDEISDHHSPYRFMMPPPDQFVSRMGQLGVGKGTRVVLYDRDRNMWAARVWWMLRHFGFTDAAVLDGGWTAWLADGGDVSQEPAPSFGSAGFDNRHTNDLLVQKQHVIDAVHSGGACIVNALGADQHDGRSLDYGRRGHIPGAMNVPAGDLVDPATHRFLPMDELQARTSAVPDDSEEVIVYCGGGISAANDAFVLALLGREDVVIYDGSMSEWAADPSLPLEW